MRRVDNERDLYLDTPPGEVVTASTRHVPHAHESLVVERKHKGWRLAIIQPSEIKVSGLKHISADTEKAKSDKNEWTRSR